jgi:preprotein translocase subunit SecD
MTDIDTQARTAARAAHDAVATVEIPESETVVRRRRAQHRTRAAVAGGVITLVLVAAVAAALAVAPGTSGAKPPIANPSQPAVQPHAQARLEFRAVNATVPYAGGPAASCQYGKIVTPWRTVAPDKPAVLPDQGRQRCYLVGPSLMPGAVVTHATPAHDPTTGAWVVNVEFANDDFVTKVAQPYAGKQVAISIDGTVYSAPTINPGITGRAVTISGNFSETDARKLAARMLP